MRRIRIERAAAVRPRLDADRYPVLPIDPRDPDVVRAKQLLRDRDRAGRRPVS